MHISMVDVKVDDEKYKDRTTKVHAVSINVQICYIKTHGCVSVTNKDVSATSKFANFSFP